MIALISIIHEIISLYTIVLIIYLILSWLVAFNVVNPRQQLVAAINRITSALVDPVLTPIRKIVPVISGIDFSPLVLILVLHFVDIFITRDLVAGF